MTRPSSQQIQQQSQLSVLSQLSHLSQISIQEEESLASSSSSSSSSFDQDEVVDDVVGDVESGIEVKAPVQSDCDSHDHNEQKLEEAPQEEQQQQEKEEEEEEKKEESSDLNNSNNNDSESTRAAQRRAIIERHQRRRRRTRRTRGGDMDGGLEGKVSPPRRNGSGFDSHENIEAMKSTTETETRIARTQSGNLLLRVLSSRTPTPRSQSEEEAIAKLAAAAANNNDNSHTNRTNIASVAIPGRDTSMHKDRGAVTSAQRLQPASTGIQKDRGDPNASSAPVVDATVSSSINSNHSATAAAAVADAATANHALAIHPPPPDPAPPAPNQDNLPGAFNQRGRPVGGVPHWLRHSQRRRLDELRSTGVSVRNVESRRRLNRLIAPLSRIMRSITDHEDDIVRASPVDAEAVVYATHVTSETKEQRKRLCAHIILAVICVIAVIVGVTTGVLLIRRSDPTDVCVAPRNGMDPRKECRCFNSLQRTTLQRLEIHQRRALSKLTGILVDEQVLDSSLLISETPNLTESIFACDDQRLALLLMAEQFTPNITGTGTLDLDNGDLVLFQESETEDPKIFWAQRYSLFVFHLATTFQFSEWEHSKGWLEPSPVCTWFGVKCTFTGRATDLLLSANGLNGTLPNELGALTFLRTLDLGDNPGIRGTFPDTFNKVSTLREIDVRKANMIGTIPENITSSEILDSFVVSHNQFSGTIPIKFGELQRLRVFKIEDNQFTGTLPSLLGNAISLETFTAYNNNLVGTIPPELAYLRYLETFNVRNNSLTGVIPTSLQNLTRLAFLDVSFNDLTGEIPPMFLECNNSIFEAILVDCLDHPPPSNQTCDDVSTRCCRCAEDFPHFNKIGFD